MAPASEPLAGLLREGRARAGATVAELAARTRIREAIVRRLESGDPCAELPEVIVRGFVRALARELRVAPDDAAARFDAALAAGRAPDVSAETAAAAAPGPVLAGGLDGRSRFGVALFVLMLIVIVSLTLSLLLGRGASHDRAVSFRAAPAADPTRGAEPAWPAHRGT